MKRRTLVCSALLALLCAVPASAGTVYVPILSNNGVGSHAYTTRIWLTNNGNQPESVETLVIPMNVDGTLGREDGQKNTETVTVRAGKTAVIELDGVSGLLEITSTGDNPDKLAINAEIRTQGLNGAEVTHSIPPVIGSANLLDAGNTATLQGLRRTEQGVFTNVVLANLGHDETQCTVKVFRAGGVQVAGTALLTLKALTQVQFGDALAILGEKQAADVNAQITCDQPFYAYLSLYETSTGEVAFIRPSASGDSSLRPPGDDQPSVPGAVLFTQHGTFHTPNPSNPTKIFNIAVPGDRAFSNVVLDFDFFHGGWFGQDPGGLHSLVWLHRGACCWPQWAGNITVFANAFGPNKNQIKMISNMEQARFDPKSKGETRFALQPGQTYHAHFEYDTSTGVAFLDISQRGNRVARLTMPTTTNRLRPDGTEAWMIYFGHENVFGTGHGAERPSYGWRYENLRVEFLP